MLLRYRLSPQEVNPPVAVISFNAVQSNVAHSARFTDDQFSTINHSNMHKNRNDETDRLPCSNPPDSRLNGWPDINPVGDSLENLFMHGLQFGDAISRCVPLLIHINTSQEFAELGRVASVCKSLTIA
ncbi:unnamed protein product [Victoria cruziana]